MAVARRQVHALSEQSTKAKRHPVGPSLAFSVSNSNGLHVLFVVNGMVPCWRSELDGGGILGRLKVRQASRRGGGEVSCVEEVVATFEAARCSRGGAGESTGHCSAYVGGRRAG